MTVLGVNATVRTTGTEIPARTVLGTTTRRRTVYLASLASWIRQGVQCLVPVKATALAEPKASRETVWMDAIATAPINGLAVYAPPALPPTPVTTAISALKDTKVTLTVPVAAPTLLIAIAMPRWSQAMSESAATVPVLMPGPAPPV